MAASSAGVEMAGPGKADPVPSRASLLGAGGSAAITPDSTMQSLRVDAEVTQRNVVTCEDRIKPVTGFRAHVAEQFRTHSHVLRK